MSLRNWFARLVSRIGGRNIPAPSSTPIRSTSKPSTSSETEITSILIPEPLLDAPPDLLPSRRTVLTKNFPLHEWQAKSDRPLTAADLQNAASLSWRLEVIRRALGDVPTILTSYIRTGSEGQHGDGTAIDFEPVGHTLSARDIFDRVNVLAQSGELGPFGQLIFYPFSDGHIHLSLQTGTRVNQILIADATEEHFETPTPTLIASLPGSVVAGIGAVILIGGALWLARGGKLT